jgi:hypothetical protein
MGIDCDEGCPDGSIFVRASSVGTTYFTSVRCVLLDAQCGGRLEACRALCRNDRGDQRHGHEHRDRHGERHEVERIAAHHIVLQQATDRQCGGTPSTSPPTTTQAPVPRNSQRTCVDWAPSATLMAISCVRRLTA